MQNLGNVPVLRTHERIWQNFSFNWLLLKATIPVFECKEIIINFTKRKFFMLGKPTRYHYTTGSYSQLSIMC